MKKAIFLILSAITTLSSCEKKFTLADNYIVRTDSSIDNSEILVLLDSIPYLFDDNLSYLHQMVTSVPTISVIKTNKGIELFKEEIEEVSSLKTQLSKSEPEKVILKDQVNLLFDPENDFCALPRKVFNVLKKRKTKGVGWAPEYVTRFLSELPDTAIYLQGRSVSILLHSVKIKTGSGHIFDWVVMGSPTFHDVDVERYLISETNSFFYSLDGSGYLNSAIEASGTIPGADINASAKSALENKKSMFIGGGTLVSPLIAAFYGNASGVELDTLERIQILKALESIPQLSGGDSIAIPYNYQAIWMSNEGNSSFNGQADLNVSSKMGFGVANFSTSGKTGVTLSRTSSFTSYKTFFTDRTINSGLKPFTLNEVNAKIASLQSGMN